MNSVGVFETYARWSKGVVLDRICREYCPEVSVRERDLRLDRMSMVAAPVP
jgi:hypothetical protein